MGESKKEKFKDVIELDDLFEEKKNVEERMDNFFGDDKSPHYGDRGYQDLCERLNEIQEQIDEINKEDE